MTQFVSGRLIAKVKISGVQHATAFGTCSPATARTGVFRDAVPAHAHIRRRSAKIPYVVIIDVIDEADYADHE